MVDTRYYVGRTEGHFPKGHPVMADRCLPFNVILYVDQGSYFVKRNGEWRKYLPGEAFVITPFIRHDVRIDEDTKVTWVHLACSSDVTTDILSRFEMPDVFSGADAETIRGFCAEIVKYSEQNDDISEIELQRSSISLLLFLIKNNKVHSKINPQSHVSTPFTDAVDEYLKNHLGEQIKVPELARALYMSEATLRRHFTADFGTSPKNYIQEVQLNYACTLLLTMPLTTEAEVIAEAAGFSDLYYFNNLFKKNFFMSPSEYRTNCYR